jgi:hypothetical protein
VFTILMDMCGLASKKDAEQCSPPDMAAACGNDDIVALFVQKK